MNSHNKGVNDFCIANTSACAQALPMLIDLREQLMEAFGLFLPGSKSNYPIHNELDEVIRYCQICGAHTLLK